MNSVPKVSVVCLAYNHRSFIGRCLDGFVSQKTDFPFEVIVHDDASCDGTAEVISEYAAKYPEIIRPVLQQENQWRKGVSISQKFVFPLLRGEYVAFCEGDDYWTDENKLQKQVDFLDENPEYSICFHPVEVVWSNERKKRTVFPAPSYRFGKSELELSDLLKHNFIQTNSVLLRWRFHRDPFSMIPEKILPQDWFIFLLHAELGKIKYLPGVMSVYRKHDTGVWCGARRSREWFVKKSPFSVRFFEAVKERYKYEHTAELVLMKYACLFAEESSSPAGKFLRCFKLIPAFFALIFASGKRRIFWKNYGKALLISLLWK